MEKSNPCLALHDPVYVIFQQFYCRHLLPAAALGLRRPSCHQKHLNTDLRQAGLMPSMSSKTRALLHSRHPPLTVPSIAGQMALGMLAGKLC